MRGWMRTAAVLCVLGLGVGSVGAAQGAEFGVIGGANFARLSLGDGNALDNAKSRTSFAGGVFVTIRLGTVVAIQPEALLALKGTKASNPSQSITSGDLKLSLDYVEFPLLVKAYIPLGNPGFRPNVFAGPAFSFLIDCRVGEDVLAGTRRCDLGGPTIKNTDTSIMFGGGADFLDNFTAQVRFDLGLDDVDEEPGSARNRGLLLMVGYRFQL